MDISNSLAEEDDATRTVFVIVDHARFTRCAHTAFAMHSQPFMTHKNVSEGVKNNADMYNFLLDGYFGPHPIRFGAYVAPEGQDDISDESSQLEGKIHQQAIPPFNVHPSCLLPQIFRRSGWLKNHFPMCVPASNAVTIWHNSTFRDAIPLHYSHLINCIAQERTGVPDAVFVRYVMRQFNCWGEYIWFEQMR